MAAPSNKTNKALRYWAAAAAHGCTARIDVGKPLILYATGKPRRLVAGAEISTMDLFSARLKKIGITPMIF